VKVWLVTSGIYSDYKVERVFARKEDAEMYVTGVPSDDDDEYDSDGRRVDEYDLIESLGDRVEVLELHEEVIGAHPGDLRETVRTYWTVPDADEIKALPACKCYDPRKSKYSSAIRVSASGTDHERVRKVFSEKRAQAVAML